MLRRGTRPYVAVPAGGRGCVMTERLDRDEILSRIDYVQFYSECIPGFRANGGTNVSCRCPFHDDHAPSLSVNVETGLWNCHGCNAQGSAVDFVMRLQGCDVGTALRRLTERVQGVVVTTPRKAAEPTERRIVST